MCVYIYIYRIAKRKGKRKKRNVLIKIGGKNTIRATNLQLLYLSKFTPKKETREGKKGNNFLKYPNTVTNV